MKKLMMAVAIVCAAVMAQASSFNWTISSMNKFYNAGTSTLLTSGTAYLFCIDSYTQAALLDAGSIDTSKALATGTVKSGTLDPSPVNLNYGNDGETHQYWMALIDGDNIYVSANVSKAGVASKDTGLAMSATNSKNAAVEWTKGGSFSSAGWYTSSAPEPVPEPTSGLLIALGMAGLALRRRRA